MINIKRAYWRNKSNVLSDLGDYEIATTVLEQNGIYFDPSDSDFLDKIFKEYVLNFLEKDKITLELSKEDIFFYGENANVYMLNYIYADFFPTKAKKPFNPIIEDSEDGGKINLSLFNGFDEQLKYLIEILEKMKISFEELSNKYMLLSFPNSIECYSKNKVFDLRYEDWTKR